MEERIMQQFHISKASPVPLYYQLKTQLLELLKQGMFQPGDKLPTEAEFCELLDISRPTVRQAFSELINEGYITRQKAKGTFVSQPKIEGYFFQKLISFDEEMRSLHLTPSTSVIISEVIPLPKECQDVYPNSTSIFHLQRLRYANDEKMVLVNTFVPYERFPDIEMENFEKESLYDVFLRRYHTEVAYVDRSVEARKAGQMECTMLGMEKDGALMHVESIAYTAQDVPIEYSIAQYRGDRNKFKMRLIHSTEKSSKK